MFQRLILSGFVAMLSGCIAVNPDDLQQNWPMHRGSPESNQYSSLDQINTTNVDQLKVAWTYRTGDASNSSTIECNPVIVNGILYATSPKIKVFALNAANGEELWTFDPNELAIAGGVNRGVTYWEKGVYKRIYFSAGNFLFALNATTGAPILNFGLEGKIDLREGLDADPAQLSITISTPGIIYEDLLIVGSSTGEGYNASPGHVRGYDLLSGERKWIFHTIPKPGQFGYNTWDWVEGENYGGANNWSGMSLDEKRGWVFFGTGSPTYDFYGKNRRGANLFGNCILALDARTGKRIWRFQAVQHDLWDYDLACAPNLASITHQGLQREVVIQPTKMGTLIVLDRETGEILNDVENLPTPSSDVPGEIANHTQPIIKDLVITRQGFPEDSLTNISVEANQAAREKFANFRSEGLFTPPSIQGTLAMPGTRGGFIWGGASFDQSNQMLYANANEIPLQLKVRAVNPDIARVDMEDEGKIVYNARGRNLYLSNCSSCHGIDRMGVDASFPALINIKDSMSREEISTTIKGGRDVMPAHGQFDTDQIESLVDFLMDIKRVDIDPDDTGDRMERYVLEGFNIFTDHEGYPGIKPPWGTLNAVDMNTFTIKWKVPLGTYPELKKRGLPDTGTQSFGGCVATAGGLIFVGGSADEKFRAYDTKTGNVLWEHQLPVGGYATPSVYMVNGKQYVVIAAGGGNRNRTPSGDYYYAFSL